MPAGFVAGAEIRGDVHGALVEQIDLGELPGGPLGSIRPLAALLAPTKERMKPIFDAGDECAIGTKKLFTIVDIRFPVVLYFSRS